MKKTFDVHFKVIANNYLSSIEADNESEAKQIALDMLSQFSSEIQRLIVEGLEMDLYCSTPKVDEVITIEEVLEV